VEPSNKAVVLPMITKLVRPGQASNSHLLLTPGPVLATDVALGPWKGTSTAHQMMMWEAEVAPVGFSWVVLVLVFLCSSSGGGSSSCLLFLATTQHT
jgi:hypothetical protein